MPSIIAAMQRQRSTHSDLAVLSFTTARQSVRASRPFDRPPPPHPASSVANANARSCSHHSSSTHSTVGPAWKGRRAGHPTSFTPAKCLSRWLARADCAFAMCSLVAFATAGGPWGCVWLLGKCVLVCARVCIVCVCECASVGASVYSLCVC